MRRILEGRKGKPVATLLLVIALTLGVVACGGASNSNSSSSSLPPLESGGKSSSTSPTTSSSGSPAGSYRLVADGKRLTGPGGERVQVEPKAVIGYLDNAIPEGKIISLSGWAAPADLSRPAERVVAFAGKTSVATLVPSGERPDLVKGYNRPGLLRSGFILSIPVASLNCSAPAQGLAAFGIVSGVASPLERLGDVDQRLAEACQGNAP